VLYTKTGYKIAPAICYESIYGEYMSKYIRNGANLICIITNDGWWKNTPGHKQHMNYARLRAIETGKWIARSANTGISCFIDPNGTVINPQPWDTAAAIKLNVPVFSSSKETFFVRQGDILSRVMLILALLLIAGNIILWVLKKFFKKDYTILRSGNG
jgi:apolipoprotein N-acyltransferase